MVVSESYFWDFVVPLVFCSLMLSFIVFRFSDDAPETRIEVRYDVMELPINLPCQKPPADKPNPKQGIGKLESESYHGYAID